MFTITEYVVFGVVSKWAEEKRKSVQASGTKNGKAPSSSLINLKNCRGAGNVFSKAFNQWKAAKHLFRLFKSMLKEEEFY